MKKHLVKLLPIASLFLLTGCADGVSILKKHCTIKFNSNGGTEVREEKIDVFTTPTEPADPSKDGYDFLGWYYDNKTFNYRFNFEQKLCQDVTLHAKWEETPPVTFNSNTLYTNEMVAPHGYDYVAQIRLKEEYAEQNCFSIPTEKAYYAVVINGHAYDGFTIKTTNDNAGESVKLIIPHDDITGSIQITAEAHEKYLTFTNYSSNDITLTRTITGSLSHISNWACRYFNTSDMTHEDVTWSSSSETFTIEQGHKLQILSSGSNKLSTGSANYMKFSTSESIIVSGDVTSLVDHNPSTNYCFYGLFNGFSFASGTNLYLPHYNLTAHCYENMFKGAQGLSIAPILPAEDVPASAYQSMFEGCSDLSVIELAAVNLKDNALNSMLKGDTKLQIVKVGFGTYNSVNWPSASNATKEWLPTHTPLLTQTFVWKGSSNMFDIEESIYNSTSKIPSGWLVANLY